jgi:hypothetical protein
MNDRELRTLIASNEIHKGTTLHIDGHMFNVHGNIYATFSGVNRNDCDSDDQWTPLEINVKANFGELGGVEKSVCFANDIIDYMNFDDIEHVWADEDWENLNKKEFFYFGSARDDFLSR